MKSTRISIIGHYGANSELTDGQTVKIRSLVSALRTFYPNIKVCIVDTYYLINNKKMLFCWQLLCAIITSSHIIFFPAARGRKYMFCFFYYVSKIFKVKCFHSCIAGSLDVEIIKNKFWIKYLNGFEFNLMESPEQVEKLKSMGIANAEFLPNFKNLTEVVLTDKSDANTSFQVFNFCIFSRILAMKGVEDAVDAVKYIRCNKGVDARLDIYGPIEPGEEVWFESICLQYSDFVSYKGVVHYDKSVEVLKDYFALLFPTRYYTEGMPGTIIDAMYAGVPVIARRWAWCDNMVTNGYNGISYDFDHPEYLKDVLEQIIDNPKIITDMKANCLNKAKEYSPELIIAKIVKKMGLEYSV